VLEAIEGHKLSSAKDANEKAAMQTDDQQATLFVPTNQL